MKERLTIKDLPVKERPRERLMQHGPGQLANTELLAIILRTGSTRRTVAELAGDLLASFGDLQGLARASLSELAHCHGVGPAKAVQLKAAFELGGRLLSESPAQLPLIKDPAAAAKLLQAGFHSLDREHFRVMHLNIKNQVLKVETIAIGMLNAAPIHPREVFKEAVRMSSAGLIVAHNHPSGDPSPSRDDLLLTRRLSEAGAVLGITIIDHIIFGNQSYVSLKERGELG